MSPRKEVIGDATLYLGDCREILPTLPRVDAVVTDPPFGMGFQSKHRLESHAAIAGDKDGSLLQWACQLEPKHAAYVFCRWDNLQEIPLPRSLVTWVKNNWSMGDLEHEHGRQTEVCAFYPGPQHYWPVGRPNDVIECQRTGNELHPTQKPVALMEHFVRLTAGTVIDPFMGSGTTGVACIKLGRKFIGIEIEPKYFDIACRRIEEAWKQPRLFEEPRPKPVQEALDL